LKNDVNVPSKSKKQKNLNPNPDPDSLVRGTDARIQIRIWIHTKMSWIRNTVKNNKLYIPAVLASTGAFAGLHATNVSCLVGRWPEEIPNKRIINYSSTL
jgi:hypothetical protein